MAPEIFTNVVAGLYPKSVNPNLFVPLGASTISVKLPSLCVAQYSVDPAADDAAGYLASKALTSEAQEITTFDGDVDVCRQILVTANVNTIVGDVILTGLGFNGEALTETITLADDGATAYLSTKMFSSITQVDLPALTTAGDEISVGSNDTIAFPFIDEENVILKVTHDGSEDSTYAIVSNADYSKCTLTPTNALDGNTINVYFLV